MSWPIPSLIETTFEGAAGGVADGPNSAEISRFIVEASTARTALLFTTWEWIPRVVRGSECPRRYCTVLTSVPSATKYQTGRETPGVLFLLLLLERFKVNPAWLITGEGPMFVERRLDGSLVPVADPAPERYPPELREIISAYTSLNKAGKDGLLDYARFLMENPKYVRPAK